MKLLTPVMTAIAAAATMLCMVASPAIAEAPAVELPQARRDSGYALERALAARRSVREFRDAPLRLEELAQLVWAAQGEVAGGPRRTAPSAGALYPLELFVVAGSVQGLAAGVYRYQPATHQLASVAAGDRRGALAAAALAQSWIGDAPAILVVAGVERRTTARYGARGVRYVHMEAGHAAQNVLLQAVALGLGGTVVGAFSDSAVKAVVALPGEAQPLYLIPVGRPR
ncbi:MAG TPA: SagB/ThcOx family dehydrogenase [Burkholderiales bacterium]|nr:SagB/ThcOx family dehydrogenase [Burkholderiales bacterium]